MRRIVLLAVAGALAVPAPAGAQAIATASPNAPGRGTKLHFDLDATAPPVAGRVPSALAVSGPAGSTLDFKAAGKRCSKLRATLNECRRESRIGTGSLVIQVNAPTEYGGVRDVHVPLTLYLQSNTSLLAVAFLAGYRVVPGTISRSGGFAMTFDPLPKPPEFAQVAYALKRITLDVGVSRLVIRGKPSKTRGQRRHAARRTRVYLVRTPAQCTGTWASSVTLTFPDGTTTVVDAPMTCSQG
jgi:hypothetical protein